MLKNLRGLRAYKRFGIVPHSNYILYNKRDENEGGIMSNKSFILNLGKLLIAAAWADGKLTNQEINALKELLFLLPEISGEEWMELELYMESPVGEEERQKLLGRVLDGMASTADKTLVLETLGKLIHCEDVPKEAEASIVESLRQDIESKSTGILAHLMNPLKRAIGSRVGHYSTEGGRESRIDDYIKNTIYYQLFSEMKTRGCHALVVRSGNSKGLLGSRTHGPRGLGGQGLLRAGTGFRHPDPGR